MARGSHQGVDGSFRTGDVGTGRLVAEGWAEICWPNGTRTRTAWPNASWYKGEPFRLGEPPRDPMPLLVKTRIGEAIMLGLEARATIGTAKVLIQGTDGIPPA